MKRFTRRRRGATLVLIAVLMTVLLGMGAFAIDVGYIEYSRARLQAGADAAALAAVQELPNNQATLDSTALDYANLNGQGGGDLQSTVEGGTWDANAQTFSPGDLSSASAVRVTLKRPDLKLFFGPLIGTSYVDVTASAVATRATGGMGTRFLIDDEMIDTDVPSIENLANSLGKSTDELLTARGFNQGKQYGGSSWTWEDNFLDIPPGSVLMLPTGQGTDYDNNDAGMFDIDYPEFPFTDYTDFMKFIMYSETGGDTSKWGTDDSGILSQLDPLVGVAPVTDGSKYSSYVDPDFVHVSPVFPSDVSTLNMSGTTPQVNAKGLRRGLIAFKIIAVGGDPDGSGSVLPELELEIVDPATVDPNDLRPYGQAGGSSGLQLVQ